MTLKYVIRTYVKRSRRGLVDSVLGSLLDEKSGFRVQNEIRNVFLRRFFLSRLLEKLYFLRVNKISMESFSKNLQFGVDFKL